MKASVLTIVLFISVSCVCAQGNNAPAYVFPTFVNGTVLQKNGGATNGVLNYNTLTQEMLFMQDGVKTVLDVGNVDTVYIQGKKFIPVGSVYYEKLTDTKIALYEQHFNKRISISQKADFDKSAAVNNAMTASQGILKAVNEPSKYELTVGDGYTTIPENELWLQKGKSFYSAKGLKKIVKVFTDKEQAIETYIKENNLDINKPEDVAKLVVFLNKLI